MPGVVEGSSASRKRKREAQRNSAIRSKVKVHNTEGTPKQDILALENQVAESRRYYNNIATLINIYKESATQKAAAAVSLCRVFSRLIAAESMKTAAATTENEGVVIQWLRERYREYIDMLLGDLHHDDEEQQTTALTLLMQLLKEESSQGPSGVEYRFSLELLEKLLSGLVTEGTDNMARERFITEYFTKFADIRYYTFMKLAEMSSEASIDSESEMITANMFSILSAAGTVPQEAEDLENFYTERPSKKKSKLLSVSSHKKYGQDAWLSLLRRPLSKGHRKSILKQMSHTIAPWFVKVELLMDFLTDSFNEGGSTSLLALSGLFFLVREKNLDYPSFYPKLYSLLDADILHSRHRSRFFRLLDVFLASTHLPAQLVASFIKRLSRLTLQAPPAAIVAIVPWIYNLLKRHPICTFMIHREIRDKDYKREIEENGMDDPFVPNESDPMRTDAIESSLWEIVTLQSHYHPNVATLAKIISEQFTKQSYNLEDFLDHSYATMFDAELTKNIKKPPVVEYEISKCIFTTHDPESGLQDSPLVKLWDFS